MTKFKRTCFFIIITMFLQSCNTLSDAGKILRNEKIKNTDEFLVKKREPLVLPPDFNEIPLPRSIKEKKNNSNKEKTIKEILNISKDTNNAKSNNSSSIEDSILKKIRK